VPPQHRLYLIPGFFGFANLGQITYFGHVRRELAGQLAELGVRAHLHVVRTPPTASLPERAACLAKAIAETAGRADPLHLVGHSSGGLDARLLLSPGVALPTRVDVERVAARVRTLVTVSTPHHGTPLAGFFATLRGQRLLELLSLATIHALHLGSVPLAVLLRLAGLAARAEDGAASGALLDELFRRLLQDFSVGRRRAVRALLREVARDQALLLQLTPEAMQVFRAAVAPRPGVREGSVVAQARRPSVRSQLEAGLDPAAQATRVIFGRFHRLAAATPARLAPALAPAQERALRCAYGRVPDATANDGIVPTRSQVFGRVVHAAVADHLDVLGHFHGRERRRPPHVDWLVTGSGFDSARFGELWGAVAGFAAA
jgi:hypothetical protein